MIIPWWSCGLEVTLNNSNIQNGNGADGGESVAEKLLKATTQEKEVVLPVMATVGTVKANVWTW